MSGVTARSLVYNGALAFALTACQPAGGVLEPLASPGVTIVGGNTVRIRHGGATADVSVNWTHTGDSIEVNYVGGSSPLRIAMAGTISYAGETAGVDTAWDRTTAEPGSVYGRSVAQDGGVMRMKAGERRKVVIEFKPFGTANAPGHEDEVSVAVPMPGAPVPVRFRYGGR